MPSAGYNSTLKKTTKKNPHNFALTELIFYWGSQTKIKSMATKRLASWLSVLKEINHGRVSNKEGIHFKWYDGEETARLTYGKSGKGVFSVMRKDRS